MKVKKGTSLLLCISLVLVLVGSIFAGLFNGGLGSTKVSRISFEAANGTLSGLLYMPKDASSENPKPAIIVTHGYLNSAEMQDANAIELSRRGFVVLALDQYDHGHSKLNASSYNSQDFFGMWLPFWVNSMNDAVQYMYEQPYVLKDSAGNGIIGVEGHSMGGFSTTMALAMDEMQFATTGVRKVYAGLTEGADFSYSAFAGVDVATADSLGGGRYMGKVAAQYDEFFFNDPTVSGGTVRQKNYVATDEAKTWLQQENPTAGTWYQTSDGGQRIIYQPSQTHPWNHFSKTTTGMAISFFTTAFADYSSYLKNITPNNQIWQLKEFFELIALIGFVMMLVPLVMIITELPFFNGAKTETLALAAPKKELGSRLGNFATLFVLLLLPAFFFAPLIDGGAGSATVNFLFYLGLVFAFAGIIGFILSGKEKDHRTAYRVSSCLTVISGIILAVIAKVPMYQNLAFWVAPAVNDIAYWTIACAFISLLAMSAIFLFSKVKEGASFKDYGVVFDIKAILAGLCTAIFTVVIAYLVLGLMDFLFKADFRIWTFAFKTFDMNILPAFFKYLPTFLIFYLVSTASITVNTNTEALKGIKGYLVAIALNAGGIMLWLINQYGTLFAKGVSAHPESALSGIILVAMVPTLSIAAIISRALYKRLGNIWTPAFLNAILMTLMTVANTTVFLK
ncbi:alpha/beta hydrolase [Butyrivibrio sp. VCB2006]|uniref:alpha/beta hydrolase n=1 Tax=Butyrivibrio sp. VCB2006 TaxID=1280679 RepID=UPI000427AA9A|nr:alpha/beta hydrolase [Butyrivibrio sp. VCB2006]